jgi:hypothetical protein
MPGTSCRPVPPYSLQNAHCSAARCCADSRVRGGRCARTLISARPTCRSRAPKRSSQERSTAAKGSAVTRAWFQPSFGRASAGRPAGTRPTRAGPSVVLVLVFPAVLPVLDRLIEPVLPHQLSHVQVIQLGHVVRVAELLRVPRPLRVACDAVQQDRHEARLGVRLGQSRPGPARVGHRLGRRPGDRFSPAAVTADPPASRQPDRADPHFTIRGHISRGHDIVLRRRFQLAPHATLFPALDLNFGAPASGRAGNRPGASFRSRSSRPRRGREIGSYCSRCRYRCRYRCSQYPPQRKRAAAQKIGCTYRRYGNVPFQDELAACRAARPLCPIYGI